jgi:uncharacterized membrane-anchored protein
MANTNSNYYTYAIGREIYGYISWQLLERLKFHVVF